ncbi:MAG TPA: phosphoribosyltransferase [Verrucomicrobiales bacterium]|nr:phosphoribosyltransferase [Verrucomicrobiales bacterium]
MNSELTPFKDRVHAGRLLAGALRRYAGRDDVVVLGLPRGGVPVAFEVAEALHAPLDVIVVRKLGVPGWEELAMGAISTGGIRVLNEEIIRRAGISREQIEAVTARELAELRRRETAFRGRSGTPDIAGKTVLLIDDGIATGSTIQAAVKVLRAQKPAAIVIAVPTASVQAFEMLRGEVDDFVSLMIPENFHAVGQWYEDFDQTSDAGVKALLAEAANA